MECADTVQLIASYLSKRDLVAVSGVSRLCRQVVTAAFISLEEKQYLVWPCLKEDHVELAPPSQVLALGVLGNEQQLLVLIRSGLETSNLRELECYLYSQLITTDGTLADYQKELPPCFAYPSSSSRFVGNRFLVCTTRESELHVFDCLVGSMLELPFGADGFYASPDGERFLIDYDRHAHLCLSTTHIYCWWEMRQVDPKWANAAETYGAASHTAHGALVAAHLRAQICLTPDVTSPSSRAPVVGAAGGSACPPPRRYYLGASSVAWRTFWLGGSSVLYACEAGVFLLHPEIPGTDGTLKAEPLPLLSSVCADLVDSSCGDVDTAKSTTSATQDEYVLVNYKELRVYLVHYTPQQTAAETMVDLAALVPARSTFVGVRVVVPRRTYLLYLRHFGQDRVLLFSADLTLTRWIALGPTSCFVLWRQQASLVTAPLPDDLGDRAHPLLEAVEGGLGTVYSFGMRLPDGATSSAVPGDPFVSAAKVRAVCGDVDGIDTAPSSGNSSTAPSGAGGPQPFNGVEALSWIAFGVVSASLLWTVSALFYNGWWLHLQLLFWGKIT